ncbi:hypothetical protein DMN91_009253 [Ooceraea biroi]|uniref:RNase H type-1 domain-containing protein n=1 Tax=Ooceraea biroi TaxID=2015173 RepID=A0A3L8DEM6_OOCBI|nr:hypothetical protein DMN91_009253 [Ooceraea biroi]
MKENLSKISLELEPAKTNIVIFRRGGMQGKVKANVSGVEKECEQEAKFLGVWLDNGLTFKTQTEEISSKVNKANELLKYMNRITWGMEMSTVMMLYKSLVRSVIDYGVFVYYPTEEAVSDIIEKAQFKGIRTVMGYRITTPKNVMLAESKLMTIRDRAGWLARRFFTKVLVYGDIALKDKVAQIAESERDYRFRYNRGKRMIISEAWDRVRKELPNNVNRSRKFEVFDIDFWDNTDGVDTDVKVGKLRSLRKISNQDMVEKVKKNFNLQGQVNCLYTDASKMKDGIAVGGAVYEEEQNRLWSFSVSNKCFVFTGELMATWMSVREIEGSIDGSFLVLSLDRRFVGDTDVGKS